MIKNELFINIFYYKIIQKYLYFSRTYKYRQNNNEPIYFYLNVFYPEYKTFKQKINLPKSLFLYIFTVK